MRADSVGLFWQDIQAKGPRTFTRVMPDIPETGWKAPREFPRLDSAPYISFDVEGYDPELLTHGPGWGRGQGKGELCGISVSVPEKSWYFPFRHRVRPEENLDPIHVLAWAKDTLSNPNQPKIGANLLYDVGWLQEEGIDVKGPLYDVQYAEALLSEAAETNLGALGIKYLNEGKETTLLYQWCADYYGGKPNHEQRKNIYRTPPSLVGPYAERDASHPARILPLQWERLSREGLVDLFEMETRLTPLLIRMRRAGVSVDIKRAEFVRDQLVIYVKQLEKELSAMAGMEVNCDANDSLQKLFRKLGLPIPLHHKTEKPCFSKDTLPLVEHPAAELILKIRKYDKVRSTFIESYILDSHVNGKVHCQFHPLRGQEGGTRSGRFASSNPNYQNVPSRDEELAPLVRSCFIPDMGHARWRRFDYSQIEYRKLAHFAVGPGSDELRARYCSNPETDYHVDVQTLVTNYTCLKIPRKPIKNFNFGMTFGMGKEKMVRSTTTELLKLGGEFKLDGDQLYNAYHEAVPFTKATLEFYAKQAQDIGYVTTILGRRSRFELWEPDVRGRGQLNIERAPALPYYVAIKAYGRIKRAYSHKALNRVLQGSAADYIKKAMLLSYESGVYDCIGVPRLTVHDELDFSDAGGNEEAWEYMHHELMEKAIPLRIPMIAEMEVGPNWGECKKG